MEVVVEAGGGGGGGGGGEAVVLVLVEAPAPPPAPPPPLVLVVVVVVVVAFVGVIVAAAVLVLVEGGTKSTQWTDSGCRRVTTGRRECCRHTHTAPSAPPVATAQVPCSKAQHNTVPTCALLTLA